MIAPDSNRSATGRAVTLRDPIWVEEVSSATARSASPPTARRSTVRFAELGLIEAPPELIVSGINHGANLGDDITYSGTVAAALGSRHARDSGFARARRRVRPAGDLRRSHGRRARHRADARRDAPERERPRRRGEGRLRVPARQRVQRRDGSHRGEDGRRSYTLYGQEPSYEHEPGTDFAAIADGLISVTPITRPDRPGGRRGARGLRPRTAPPPRHGGAVE